MCADSSQKAVAAWSTAEKGSEATTRLKKERVLQSISDVCSEHGHHR